MTMFSPNLLISLVTVFSVVISVSAEDLKFHKITTSDGLSHNTVYAIEQDSKGFLWFGTREGLNRFDSEEIVSFYHREGDSLSLGSNHVTALASDHQFLYVGTTYGLSRYDYNLGAFQPINFEGTPVRNINQLLIAEDSSLYLGSPRGLFVKRPGSNQLEQLIAGTNVNDVREYKKGVLLISSPQQLWMVNEYGETIRQFNSIESVDGQNLDLTQNLSCLYKDKQGGIWLGTRKDGLFKYDEASSGFKQVFTEHAFNSFEANIIRSISSDSFGRIWIGTESGLLVYSPETGNLDTYRQDFSTPATSLSDKAIYSIYRSKEGIMWIGTYFGGVNMARLQHKGFNKIRADGGVKALSGKAVSEITKVANGSFWIGTEDGGITIWDKKNNTFDYLRSSPSGGGLSVDNVHTIYEAENGQIWIGTFLGGLNKYDPKSKRITHYTSNSFLNNLMYAIHEDQNGQLLLGTQGGLNRFEPNNKQYLPYLPEYFNNRFIYKIFEDSQNGFWICVNFSDTIYYMDPGGTISSYRYTNPEDNYPGSIGVISACEDSNGIMWFGTMNYGLVKFDPKTKVFRNYTVEDGLSNNYVYGVLQTDGKQELWLSTNKGLCRFNIEKEQFSNYNISHGLPNNQFNFKSAYKDEDGYMYFGTINGLCYFHPDSLIVNYLPPSIYLSDFKLFNKSVPVGEQSLLSQSINSTESIALDYSQNVITFEFAAINYFSLGNNSYAYYLEGFEEDWNFVGNKKNATYTNLSPGSYTFKVKAANNDGVWSNEVRSIQLTVHPPFWKSNWALLLYILLIVGLFLVYRMFLTYRNREKMAIQIERLEREKMTEVNRHKLNFFTNISHEFKTPLTLIIASIDKFLTNSRPNDEYETDYKSIKRNARRLQFLIEQLMEFRKIETDHAKLHYSHGDLVLYLKDTLNAFRPMFLEKSIDSNFTSSHSSFNGYFDGDKVEKVVTNLLSNAIKHTDQNGKIDMELKFSADAQASTDQLEMIISDTGHGMAPEEVDKIFAPFYRTEEGKNLSSGSGVGLALVKGLIDLMNGSIKVESNLHRGTYVTVIIPLEKHPKQNIIESIEGNKMLDMEHELVNRDVISSEKPAPDNDYEVLIVEDNPEIIQLLSGHFNQYYKVITAGNGKEALKKLEKSLPDVIISDVMMPEMDGFEFCKKVKDHIETSHIPVILLTAKGSSESKMQGLDLGADLYISKPFNLQEVDLRVKNLLESRRKLHQHFQKFANVGEDMEIPLNNRDQEFLSNLKNIVEQHLEDSNFNIGTFTQEAGVSRTLLHLKLKKLVNLSASEFVKTIRLQRAAHYLEKSDLTISEIAYKVGYGDPNYFTRSFKEKYGKSPTDYKQKSNNEPVS